MRRLFRQRSRITGRLLGLAILSALSFAMPARARDGENEYQFQVVPSHKVGERLTMLSYLGYNKSDDEDFETVYLGSPGMDYKINDTLHLRAVWYTRFTDRGHEADSFELRPSLGCKAIFPADRMHFYNLTRYEYRSIQRRDDDTWEHFNRIRSRFGVDVPLAARGSEWLPHTWYATADVEPFYELEENLISPVSARLGIVHILNENMQIEFYYAPQYTRSNTDTPFEETGSIFQLIFKIGLQAGLINREHVDVSDN